jgi:hypothetical protein
MFPECIKKTAVCTTYELRFTYHIKGTGRRALNPFRFVAIFTAKYHHLYPTIAVLYLDRFEPFKHLFASTFDGQYVDIFKINVGLLPIQLSARKECAKNDT